MAALNETSIKKPNGKTIFRVSLLAAMAILVLSTLQILFDVPIAPFLVPSGTGNTVGAALTAVYKNGVQTAEGKVGAAAYPSLIVQCGIPVEFTLNADADKINDCNHELLFPAFGLTVQLKPGANVVRFTPQESGVFPFSCWQNHIKSMVTVVESLGFTDAAENSPKSGTAPSVPETENSAPSPEPSTGSSPLSGPAPSETLSPETTAAPTAEASTVPDKTTFPETTAPTAEAPTLPGTGGAPVFEKKDRDSSLGGWLEGQLTPNGGSDGVKEIRTWTGWIFDRDCVGINPVKHTKACNLMGSCFKSGLGMFEYVPGKAFDSYTAVETFLTFDGASKELAAAFLRALPDDWKDNITIKVTGYAVNNIPAGKDELLIPETDPSLVDHYLNGIHVTSIEAAYIDGLSTNPLPEQNIVLTQP